MAVTRDGIVEQAQWVANARNGGGTYDPEGFGYPWRIVLHTIEGSANAAVIAGHNSPPHLWYDPPTRKLYQTVPLSRSAFALYQAPDAPHYTNKARALQVEIAGRAAEAGSWPNEWLDNITTDVVIPLCQWVGQVGAQVDLSWAPSPGPIPGSAFANAVQRVSPSTWATRSGLYSHRHVPMGDDHWDTGGLDTPRIAEHARLFIAGLLAPILTLGEDDMPDYLLRALDTRTVVARYPNGAVKALAYHELMWLVNDQKLRVIDTDEANLKVVMS